jgi:phosphohistidine phosphatase
MKTLYLLRHAKSSWDDPSLGDHDRRLNARGRDDATHMAELIAKLEVPPELVLCSTATRTRQTLQLAMPDTTVPVEFRERLYLASAMTLMAAIQGMDDRLDSIMLVGHNDGLHDFAQLLVGGGNAEAVRRLVQKLPTCGFVQLSFIAPNWASTGPESAKLQRFVTPRFAED